MPKISMKGWLYILGIGGAAVVGLLEGLAMMPAIDALPWILVLLGLGIGIVNISEGERVPVMVAALILGVGAGVLAGLPAIGGILEAVFLRIAFISIPVAIPPAITILATHSRGG